MSTRNELSRQPGRLHRIVALALGLVFAAADVQNGDASASEQREDQVMSDVVLGAADSGKQVRLPMGKLLILQLPENPSTGYRWALESLAEKGLRLEQEGFEPPAALMPGAGGTRVLVFRAQTTGKWHLRLRLGRPWEPADAAAETFEATVEVIPGADVSPRGE